MAREEFEQVTVLTDPTEKVVQVVVTARQTPEGTRHSFALLREFIREGDTSRTPWMAKRHIAGLRRALDLIETWYEAEELRRFKK